MAFWLFLLLMDLIVPVTMIGFGRQFIKKPPKEINAVFGYRTGMSMKNRETWDFAHKYCGKIWYVCGLILLPVSMVAMLLVWGQSVDVAGTVGGAICLAQLIPLTGSIFFTEKALKKNFDQYGNKR